MILIIEDIEINPRRKSFFDVVLGAKLIYSKTRTSSRVCTDRVMIIENMFSFIHNLLSYLN